MEYIQLMEGTTSLDDLPVMSNNDNAPVQLQVSEANTKVDVKDLQRLEDERKQLDSMRTGPQPPPMSQEQASQFVQGLQQASQTGMTSLPSRDIPMNQSQVNMDEVARANYVPMPKQNNDYIGNTQTADEIIAHSNMKKHQEDSLDSFYDEIQTPLLIAILFFVFMIPSVRALLFKSFPMLLKTDGNPTLGGYLYIAGLFGTFYFVLNKALVHFSQV
jgi:hypothetical protein